MSSDIMELDFLPLLLLLLNPVTVLLIIFALLLLMYWQSIDGGGTFELIDGGGTFELIEREMILLMELDFLPLLIALSYKFYYDLLIELGGY